MPNVKTVDIESKIDVITGDQVTTPCVFGIIKLCYLKTSLKFWI